MGSSNVKEQAPVNVIVECGSIVQDALPWVADMARGDAGARSKLLSERIARQQAMIVNRCKDDVWFSLYHGLLELTTRSVRGAAVTQADIQNLFHAFADNSERQRTQYDLATQILMIIHQLLRLSLETRDMTVAERWDAHDEISTSVKSASQRFRYIEKSIPKPHRSALRLLFRLLSGIYEHKTTPGGDGGESRKRDPTAAAGHGDDSETGLGRSRTASRRGVFSAPVSWSEED